jgi:hypothetical protein
MSETRFSKLDNAIDRLTVVASDVSKMLAVHEQRLNQQEKNADAVALTLEKRREEVDVKIDGIYAAFQAADSKVIEELKLSREMSLKQHQDQNERIDSLQKMLWIATGGCSGVGFVLSYFISYFHLFTGK